MSKNSGYLCMTPCTYFLLIVCVIALIGSIVLPASWGRENGCIEYLQAFILGLVCLASILAAYYGVGTFTRRKLFLWAVPVWLLAIGRELSWGRVFLSDAAGRMPPMSDLWFGPYVHATIIVASIVTLWRLLAHGLLSEVLNWIKYGKLPIIEILLLFCSAIIVILVEHYSHGVFGPNEELFEELAEMVCYSSLLFLVIDLGFNKKIQPVNQLVGVSENRCL
jgi:hypothetical protein